MYYSDIPSMQDVIICDPQVIFDSISELIIDRFRHSNRDLTSHEVDDFLRKGQFCLTQIDDKTKHQRSGHLKLAQLVDVLKDLNILAEIKQDEDDVPVADQSQPKFIVPAVLKYASEEELKMPVITNPEDQAVPIMIHFESGFVPFGIFCATTAHLIARQDLLSPKWRLRDDQVMKNKVTFSIDRAFLRHSFPEISTTWRSKFHVIHVCERENHYHSFAPLCIRQWSTLFILSNQK